MKLKIFELKIIIPFYWLNLFNYYLNWKEYRLDDEFEYLVESIEYSTIRFYLMSKRPKI